MNTPRERTAVMTYERGTEPSDKTPETVTHSLYFDRIRTAEVVDDRWVVTLRYVHAKRR